MKKWETCTDPVRIKIPDVFLFFHFYGRIIGMENKQEKSIDLEEKIIRLAKLLEDNGYEGAEDLIRTEIIPITIAKNCSIMEALDLYCDTDNDGSIGFVQEQDTSYFQLHQALIRINNTDLDFLK